MRQRRPSRALLPAELVADRGDIGARLRPQHPDQLLVLRLRSECGPSLPPPGSRSTLPGQTSPCSAPVWFVRERAKNGFAWRSRAGRADTPTLEILARELGAAASPDWPGSFVTWLKPLASPECHWKYVLHDRSAGEIAPSAVRGGVKLTRRTGGVRRGRGGRRASRRSGPSRRSPAARGRCRGSIPGNRSA